MTFEKSGNLFVSQKNKIVPSRVILDDTASYSGRLPNKLTFIINM